MSKKYPYELRGSLILFEDDEYYYSWNKYYPNCICRTMFCNVYSIPTCDAMLGFEDIIDGNIDEDVAYHLDAYQQALATFQKYQTLL